MIGSMYCTGYVLSGRPKHVTKTRAIMDFRKKFLVEPNVKFKLGNIDPAFKGLHESHVVLACGGVAIAIAMGGLWAVKS